MISFERRGGTLCIRCHPLLRDKILTSVMCPPYTQENIYRFFMMGQGLVYDGLVKDHYQGWKETHEGSLLHGW